MHSFPLIWNRTEKAGSLRASVLGYKLLLLNEGLGEDGEQLHSVILDNRTQVIAKNVTLDDANRATRDWLVRQIKGAVPAQTLAEIAESGAVDIAVNVEYDVGLVVAHQFLRMLVPLLPKGSGLDVSAYHDSDEGHDGLYIKSRTGDFGIMVTASRNGASAVLLTGDPDILEDAESYSSALKSYFSPRDMDPYVRSNAKYL